MIIEVDGLSVEVVKKRNKHMYLRLNDEGMPLVTAPYLTSVASVRHFVSQHLDWIERQRAKRLMVPPPKQRLCVTGEPVWLWGEELTLQVHKGSRWSFVPSEDELYLYAPSGASAEEKCSHLREWYRSQLKLRAGDVLRHWERETGLYCKEWRTKWMTSRWGTCNVRDKRIWLNVQLAKHPLESLEYVALHEVAHLKVPNHGPAFKAILNERMPDWKQRKKALNERSFPLLEA